MLETVGLGFSSTHSMNSKKSEKHQNILLTDHEEYSVHDPKPREDVKEFFFK